MTAERALRFGISVVPATDSLDRIREVVGAADETGLDLVGIQDHPYQSHFLDTWSLIPTLMADTKRMPTASSAISELPTALGPICGFG